MTIWIRIHMSMNYMSMNSYRTIYLWIICLYVYEFIYMNSYLISCKIWIHMIFSCMNSSVSWVHTWIRVYQGSRWSPQIVDGVFVFFLGWFSARARAVNEKTFNNADTLMLIFSSLKAKLRKHKCLAILYGYKPKNSLFHWNDRRSQDPKKGMLW